jgi:hypothetical protein
MLIYEKRLYLDKSDRNGPDPEEDTITIAWADEREGVAQAATWSDVIALLRHYGLEPPTEGSKEPLVVFGSAFTADVSPLDAAYRVTIGRTPVGETQEAAWRLAAQTSMYQIRQQGGKLGVFFRDEAVFVPFSQLRFDAERYKFRLV